MKSLLVGLFVLGSFSSFAVDSYFYYTKGTLRGKVVEHTGYLGYEDVCYRGNPWQARQSLLKMAQEDFEKDNVKSWYNQKNKTIEFTYVDTKCLDDSLDATEDECSNTITIIKCK